MNLLTYHEENVLNILFRNYIQFIGVSYYVLMMLKLIDSIDTKFVIKKPSPRKMSFFVDSDPGLANKCLRAGF